MVLPRNPGDQLQVDFAGGKMSYVNQQSGEMIECPILICAMPYSDFIYARALHSARQEEFLSGLSRKMTYLGAVPQSIKVDNMRVAVKQSNRYEPSFTEAMEHFADHYRTTVLAARVRKPKDKPSVEKAVDLPYKYIYAPLRDMESADSMEYPDFAHPEADAVETGRFERGILVCGSGNCMTANKHAGICAALCWTPELAALSRQHNNANILCLPARFISAETGRTMAGVFINTAFEGGRHEGRVGKIVLV